MKAGIAMEDTWKRIAGRALAFSLGVLWGFFVAFNAVFSDMGAGEWPGVVAYVFVAYALLGLAFGLAGPRAGIRWAAWLAGPAVLLLVLYSLRETGRLGWHALVLALVVAGSVGGAALGARVRATPATP
ncbi:MAG: hypothetical protein WC971_10260 [Coriobacteriia bacterium]